MKSYRMGCVMHTPQFDAMPVLLVADYPLEPRDYKPYAQGILCAGPDRLYLRMWAFEVTPMSRSCLRWVLYLFPDQPELAICVDAFSTGQAVVSMMEKGIVVQEDAAEDGMEVAPFSGEDLQGVYWGCSVNLTSELFETVGGTAAMRPGCEFQGNFYKLCDEAPFIHYGSAFPAKFPDNAFGRESMGMISAVVWR